MLTSEKGQKLRSLCSGDARIRDNGDLKIIENLPDIDCCGKSEITMLMFGVEVGVLDVDFRCSLKVFGDGLELGRIRLLTYIFEGPRERFT